MTARRTLSTYDKAIVIILLLGALYTGLRFSFAMSADRFDEASAYGIWALINGSLARMSLRD